VALPAFSRRTPLLRQSVNISVRPAHSSKPASACLQLLVHAWTDKMKDRRTDTVPFHRPCSAYYAADGINGDWATQVR